MNSLAINTRKRSKHLALSVAVVLATVLFALRTSNAQHLQKGISVQLAITSNAAPMPDADKQDAWIVAVTAEGRMFFGINPVTPAALADEMKSRPRNREQKLYLKADARTQFANVERVLEAGRSAFFEAPVLLTSQSASLAPGAVAPPNGLEVLFVAPSGSHPTTVQVLNSGQPEPTLQINNRQIPSANLQNVLTQIFQNRPERVVLVKADSELPFADVVHVIDTCSAMGAKVVLATPQL